jgi:uncharacterized protein (TIGR02453 family)
MEAILSFLKTLSRNNNRVWFEKNKEKYLHAKKTFEDFVTLILDDLVKMDESLAGLDPKKLTFRIYRDVRFSKDKRPYKTNFGAGFSPVGKGMGSPGYYVHIEPGNKSFVAGGLFMPEPAMLAKVRQEIDYNGKALEKIISDRKFRNLYKGFWDEDKLKKVPKGYPQDHPNAEMLKLKSYIMTHEFSDDLVKGKKFRSVLVKALETVKPLNLFLREAIL